MTSANNGNVISTTKNQYKIDGVEYDRITSVLNYFKPEGLYKWAVRVGKVEARKKSRVAKSIGTRVDNIAQLIMEGKGHKFTKYDSVSVVNCVAAFERWMKVEKPVIMDWQKTAWDDKLMVAGTYDIRTADCFVDIKCAERISIVYWLQVAMYRWMSGLNTPKLGILRLDKFLGDYDYRVIEFDYKLVELFISYLECYKAHELFEKQKGGIEWLNCLMKNQRLI